MHLLDLLTIVSILVRPTAKAVSWRLATPDCGKRQTSAGRVTLLVLAPTLKGAINHHSHILHESRAASSSSSSESCLRMLYHIVPSHTRISISYSSLCSYYGTVFKVSVPCQQDHTPGEQANRFSRRWWRVCIVKSPTCAKGNREGHQEVCEAVLFSCSQTTLVKAVSLHETKAVPGLGLHNKAPPTASLTGSPLEFS